MAKIFSIVTPVYNRIDYIKTMVISVKDQSFNDYELILVDNGSTDGTFEYCKSIINEKIRVYQCSTKGVSYARNVGIRKAKGEWIIILDSDNILAGKFILEKIKEVISKFSHANVILTSNISDKGILISHSNHLDKYINTHEYLESSGEFSAIVCASWYKKNLHPEIKGVINEFSYYVFIKAAMETKLVLSSLTAQIYGTQSNDRICSPELTQNSARELYIYYKILLQEYGCLVKVEAIKTYYEWHLKLVSYGKITNEINIIYFLKIRGPLLLLPLFFIPKIILKKMIEKRKQRN